MTEIIAFASLLFSIVCLTIGQIKLQKDVDELLDMVEKQLMKNEQENSDAEV